MIDIRECTRPVDGRRCGEPSSGYFLVGWRCADHTPRRLAGLPELPPTMCRPGWCLCRGCPPPTPVTSLGHLPKQPCVVCGQPMAVLTEQQDRHPLCEAS